jgi:Domain of unknown function (DUF1707)
VSEPDDSLRVSDAERDEVVRTLGDHAVVGRLTLDELEDRSGRALTAKTASIYRLPPQARGVSLKDARRLVKSAERGELPAPD